MAALEAIDVWRASGSSPGVVFFDMLELGRVADVIGLSDPDVHWVDDRWVMFLGGFTTRFVVRLFQAELPPGAALDNDDWRLVLDPDNGRRALPLVDHRVKRLWDSAGMHTPCYQRGLTPDGEQVERIYYAGRATARVTGPSSRYAIGVLERRDGTWHRLPGPVLTGDAVRPSALEPRVRYYDGRWRLWYCSAVGEVGRGEQPDHELRYVDSADGISGWSPPQTVFPRQDAFFDNAVEQVDQKWQMVLARGTNLHGTTPFPGQGLWWAEAARPSGGREDWSADLVRLLDTDVEPEPWFAHGVCGPSFHYGSQHAGRADDDTLHLFVTGTRATGPWWRIALDRLARGRLPPFPAPYYLATGRISIAGARRWLGGDPVDPDR